MHYTLKTRLLAMLLAVVMVLGMPLGAFATEAENGAEEETQIPGDVTEAPVEETEAPAEETEAPAEETEAPVESPVVLMNTEAHSAEDFSSPEIVYTPHDDYYNVISKNDYILAPGITESEIVLNNDAGSHRQVAHVVEIDIHNPYTKVIPANYKMAQGLRAKDYSTQAMSAQAAWAEANGYGNVVAAMNLSLSWYDNAYYAQHPELIGEPLGYLVLDGELFVNSQGQSAGAQTVLVINFDEKDGVARPADMPKTEIRSTKDAITGWEEQVIPANFGFLVKNGKNQYGKDNNGNNGASRSFVGIKADGSIIIVMNDGRQAPFSTGFTNYEMAEFMLSLGCVQAVNGDGGGSSTFLSQRPGEELKLNCSPSDGAERPTTHGVLVISTAPADGQFARANITTEAVYYTPGSTVTFTALGTDLVGTEAEIPADATWQLADPSMGTIENGVFVSNGTTGTVTAQMVWNDAVVGEASIEIVIPEALSFAQGVMTVPFDKEVTISLLATVNGGLHEVVLKPEDVFFTTTNEALGTFNGFQFTSVSQENAPADLTSTLTATLAHNTALVATASLSLGKGSEVLFDFESAEDVAHWGYSDVNGNDAGFVHELSFATAADGQVHDGNGSMRLYSNAIAASAVPAGGYAQLDLYMDEPIIVENAKSIGFWAYIPDEYENCWIRVLYWYDSNNDGIFDKKNTVTVINQPEVYNTVDENGWRYFSVDVSKYEKVLIPGTSNKTNFGYNATKNDANNFRFIEFMFPHTNTNELWKTYGTINGPYTIYVDNITADFSDAVDDREAPIFGAVNLVSNDTETKLEKYNTVTTTSNLLNVSTSVAENTAKTNATGLNAASAKAYVDGVEVAVTFSNGKMAINDVAVADGIHRVKFEIADNMGNKSVVIRLIKVASGVDASAVKLVPQDATLDRLYGGSIYWMDLKATNIETIQAVSAVIDLNSVNHWELDHMVLAAGFTGSYTIDAENNTATVTVTRTGVNTQAGEAVLASLPIRILYFDTDIKMEGYTADTYWDEFEFWPQDLKVDVDKGEITFVDSYTSDVLNAFSNEEFSVDSEMYAPISIMDPAYKAERGTCHVHTPEAVADVPATCTEAGYTDRTFCAVCNSVVDWGTVVSAAGHTYEAVDGELVCACGEKSNATGLQIINGKGYYAVNGKLNAGWIMIDTDWYYFDTTTYASVATYNNGYVTYEFEADGKLVSGQWHKTSAGNRYYYGPSYYKGGTRLMTWYEIDGEMYCMDKHGYAATGTRWVNDDNTGDYYTWYVFDENGASQGKWNHDGLAEWNGNYYYLKDGMSTYGMYQVDGAYYYFYFTNHFAAIRNQEFYCQYNKGLMPAGYYTFGNDGQMLDKEVFNADGVLYYYEMGKKSAGNGVFTYEGVDYVIEADGKVLFTGVITDASGKTLNYVDGVYKYIPKNGIYNENGNLYYYENDVKVQKGLVKDENGDYYYFGLKYYAVKNGTYYFPADKMNGLFPSGGTFEVDADGKVIIPQPKNGIIREDGNLYYYENNVRVQKGLVKDENGDYYYFGLKYYAVKNGSFYFPADKMNGLFPSGGTFDVDADGKVIIPQPKNGIVAENGNLYYYENNVRVQKGLVKDENGDYYYFGVKYYAVKNGTFYFPTEKMNGLFPVGGTFDVDADGKVIIPQPKNGIVAENGNLYYYENNVRVQKGLVQDENGDYYYFGLKYYAVKNGTFYFPTEKMNGLFEKGGTFDVDADGKVIIP